MQKKRATRRICGATRARAARLACDRNARLLAVGAVQRQWLHFACMMSRMSRAAVTQAGVHRASRRIFAAMVACAALPAAVHADPAGVVNALRIDGCARVPPVGAAVRRDSALDAAARELARSGNLANALARVGYPAESSRSFHVRGARDDAAVRGALESRHCAAVNDAKVAELGVHQSGDEVWIVLAGRSETPFAELQDPVAVAQRVLDLVNAARGEARRCGRDRFEPAAPLVVAPALMAAASLHSLDMAARGSLGHDGSDGSSAGDRITRAGYEWRAAGENVAAGQRDAETVVAGWLESPGHCATLMDARFTETGIAYALAPDQNPAVYWTQVFGAPR
jgi:hypothetical protein